MSKADFEAAAREGKAGHVGLVQSAHLLASGLGWQATEYTETIEPVLADVAVETGLGVVAAGQAIGQHQHAVLSAKDGHVIDYDLWMHAGCTGVDRIVIDGEPLLSQVIEGGVNGDIGTEAVVTNLVTQLPPARPGLLTMAELVTL
jgi:4-hydroxy-tetrahydrodipicolinate reductase